MTRIKNQVWLEGQLEMEVDEIKIDLRSCRSPFISNSTRFVNFSVSTKTQANLNQTLLGVNIIFENF